MSLNKALVIGRLGQDPEIRYAPTGLPVVNFSVATDEPYFDKEGKRQERTEWHLIVAWKRLAEVVGEYVSKGSKLYVEGNIHTASWEDRQSGERKCRTEIVARDLNEITLTNAPTYNAVSAKFHGLDAQFDISFNEHPNWGEAWLPEGTQ